MNSKKADISVIVNIYNEEAYLEECIESLLKQTFQPREIILVDDGSSDRSAEICQKYASCYAHIQCIVKENEGLVRARKTGLQMARGKYVSFVDGDDWLEAEWYETLYTALCASGADIVAAGHKEDLCGCITPARNLVPAGIYSEDSLVENVYSIMLNTGKISQFGIFSYLWNKLFLKEIIYPCLMNVDEDIFIGEDACSVYPAFLRSKKVQIIDYCGYHYRQRINSMVKMSYNRDLETHRLRVLANYLKTSFSNSDYFDLMLPQFENFLLSHVAVRTDGLGLFPEENLFPFSNLAKGSKILLYGAGTFGQHIYRRLFGNTDFTVVGWMDSRANEYQMLGLDVLPITSLNKLSYDSIVVAFIDSDERDKQTEILSLSPLKRKQISSIFISDEKKARILNYLFTLNGK